MKAIYLIYIFAFLFLIAVLSRIKPIQQKLQALRAGSQKTQQEETIDIGQLQFGDITETAPKNEAGPTSPGFQTLPATGPAESLAVLCASLVLASMGTVLVLKKQQ
jgi:hypothetical protein